MALYGFKGLGWFLCGVVVAPACYMVTSGVAADRAALQSIEGAIVQTQKDIRGLETEFDTRANMAQLVRWNGDVLALAAPTPDQYLDGEAALASLDSGMPGDATMQHASLVVPSGAPDAMLAAADTDADSDIETASAPSAAKPAPAAKPQPAKAPRAPVGMASRAPAAGSKGPQVAMVDRSLLSASTVADLQQRAMTEKLALR